MGAERAGLVVVAAGTGARLGGSAHKALVPLGGQPLVMHCLTRLAPLDCIGSIVLVGHPADREILAGLVAQLPHEIRLADGGEHRQDSVEAGLAALDEATELVLVHDAARPFVPAALIAPLLERAAEVGAAVPTRPVVDTVKETREDADDLCARTIPRERLRLIQTPQAFRRADLARLLQDARRNDCYATDEAGLFEAAGLDVAFVEGSALNFKVTTRDDLEIAEAILARQAERID
jgi:2-C-methyl-D-erythritol 4-phosphate cytidylyltransferase